jgi:hypothetical protein
MNPSCRRNSPESAASLNRSLQHGTGSILSLSAVSAKKKFHTVSIYVFERNDVPELKKM